LQSLKLVQTTPQSHRRCDIHVLLLKRRTKFIKLKIAGWKVFCKLNWLMVIWLLIALVFNSIPFWESGIDIKISHSQVKISHRKVTHTNHHFTQNSCTLKMSTTTLPGYPSLEVQILVWNFQGLHNLS
jgi:hypothetical protein